MDDQDYTPFDADADYGPGSDTGSTIFEGAAGVGGDTGVGEAPAAPAPPPAPTFSPPPPSAPVTGPMRGFGEAQQGDSGFGWFSSIASGAGGAFVGYHLAPTKSDRALYAGVAGVLSFINPFFGVLALWWQANKKMDSR